MHTYLFSQFLSKHSNPEVQQNGSDGQTVSKRFCLGGLARGIHIIRITLEVLAIVIFVVILLSLKNQKPMVDNTFPSFCRYLKRHNEFSSIL